MRPAPNLTGSQVFSPCARGAASATYITNDDVTVAREAFSNLNYGIRWHRTFALKGDCHFSGTSLLRIAGQKADFGSYGGIAYFPFSQFPYPYSIRTLASSLVKFSEYHDL
jgi:hypothetical protein